MSGTPMGNQPRPHLRRASVVVLATVVLIAVAGGPALAAWLVSGTGSTTAAAANVPTPAAPTTSLNASSKVVVSWQAVSLTSGQSVTGYVVRRTDTSGTRQVCSVSAPAVSCTDPNTVVGAASYTVSAVLASWTSAESPATWYDAAAPSTTWSTDSAANGSGWWTTSPVGVSLDATDVGSGVKNITYQVGAASAVTVDADTATFDVSTQGTTVITYRATDNAGNVEAQRSLTLNLDSVGPAVTDLAISPDTGASATDGVTDDNKPTITGSTEAGSTVEVRVDGTVRWTLTAAADGTFTTPAGPGAWPPGTALSDGSHTLSVRATDTNGNVGDATTFTIVIDRTDPTVTITKPTDNQVINNGQWGNGCPQSGFCGTASDTGGIWKVTYELKRKGASPAQDACWTGTAFVTGAAACGPDKMTATGTTSWSGAVPFASLTSATYELKVKAYNRAGGSGPEESVTFTKR